MKYNRTNNVIQLYPSAPAVREGLDLSLIHIWQLVCKLEEKRVGETNTSKLVTNLMFGSYNKPVSYTHLPLPSARAASWPTARRGWILSMSAR